MFNLSEILEQLPEMKSGQELLEALAVYPKYEADVINRSIPERLIALSDIYKVYVPNQMSVEIYSKLYLALIRSLQKKCTKTAVQQKYENYKAIKQQEYSGLIGGSDSFTIIGSSGIGKSSAVSRAIHLISQNRVVELQEPYTKIIPCLVVQCPFDSSVKGLLLEVLRKVDEALESNYYTHAIKARATTDMLVGSVSQVALAHIGLLVVDEIQNVVNSKHGKAIVGSLTQLINNAGISICMVGMNESKIFFEQGMQLARRSLGLQYSAMEYGAEFIVFCKTVLSYQYVQQPVEITDGMICWLYDHSGGNVSVVVSLIHDAQEIAILSGRESVGLETLQEAYQKRLTLLHQYIRPTINRSKQTSSIKKEAAASFSSQEVAQSTDCDFTISGLVSEAREEGKDIVQLLKEFVVVEEVTI